MFSVIVNLENTHSPLLPQQLVPDHIVSKLRASDGANLGNFSTATFPWVTAFDGTSIWIANISDDTVSKLRPSDGAALGVFEAYRASARFLPHLERQFQEQSCGGLHPKESSGSRVVKPSRTRREVPRHLNGLTTELSGRHNRFALVPPNNGKSL